MSEDLSKFKKKRTAVRSSLTKLINKIEGKINNENEPVDQFEAFIEQLNDKESNLSLLNTLIEDRLSVDTITEDMEASEEIKEKIIFWKTKLSSKIRRINSDSIQVDTVSRNIQVIDSNSFEYRFGNKNMLINAHLSNLLNLTPVRNPTDIVGLRNLYDRAETQIRSLESLGVKGESLLKLINTHPVETDTLGTRFGIQSFSKRTKEYISDPIHFTPLEKVELRSRKCLYCNKGHELDTCRSFGAHEKARNFKEEGLLFLCLSHGHRARECVTGESCPICNGSHHFSICFRNRHDDDLSPKRDTDNVISTVIKTEVNSVLLQTCAALIDVKNEQEVVRLFLDNGSQRSFVLKSTSEKFNFPILRKENLSICTFGAKETETKTLNIVKIKLKNRDDPNLCIEIEAVETEHISITNLPTPDRNIDKKI
ncbi:integrase catalytic domain-containing protein [Trichonephila clavipes]|nr:integrase catalytic domain-containing protein [Trichonephila clavipes]